MNCVSAASSSKSSRRAILRKNGDDAQPERGIKRAAPDDDEVCCICSEPLSTGTLLMTGCCSQYIHYECMAEAAVKATSGDKCPLCRSDAYVGPKRRKRSGPHTTVCIDRQNIMLDLCALQHKNVVVKPGDESSVEFTGEDVTVSVDRTDRVHTITLAPTGSGGGDCNVITVYLAPDVRDVWIAGTGQDIDVHRGCDIRGHLCIDSTSGDITLTVSMPRFTLHATISC